MPQEMSEDTFNQLVAGQNLSPGEREVLRRSLGFEPKRLRAEIDNPFMRKTMLDRALAKVGNRLMRFEINQSARDDPAMTFILSDVDRLVKEVAERLSSLRPPITEIDILTEAGLRFNLARVTMPQDIVRRVHMKLRDQQWAA